MALLVVFGVRALAIGAHPGWPAMAALMAAGASGRAGLVVLLRYLPPARTDGVAAALAAPPLGSVSLAVAVAVAADLFLGLGPRVVIAGAFACLAIGLIARRQIGGYTGDVLGACEQVVEAAVLSAIV
jgi:adenosylcobinamide-GDP ribazoletransferase